MNLSSTSGLQSLAFFYLEQPASPSTTSYTIYERVVSGSNNAIYNVVSVDYRSDLQMSFYLISVKDLSAGSYTNLVWIPAKSSWIEFK